MALACMSDCPNDLFGSVMIYMNKLYHKRDTYTILKIDHNY